MAGHNAYRFNPEAPHAYAWDTPALNIGMDWTKPTEKRKFKSLAEVQAAVGQESGSIQVDYQDHGRASSLVREDVQRLYKPEDYDFSPAPARR
ncbi:hypothetical protein GCM10027276_18170 [Comamonas piscis]